MWRHTKSVYRNPLFNIPFVFNEIDLKPGMGIYFSTLHSFSMELFLKYSIMSINSRCINIFMRNWQSTEKSWKENHKKICDVIPKAWIEIHFLILHSFSMKLVFKYSEMCIDFRYQISSDEIHRVPRNIQKKIINKCL